MRWIDEVATVDAPRQRRTVMIAAGHSNVDPGAVDQGYREADIVCEFRELVSAALTEQGVVHLRDGEGMTNLPLRQAAEIAAEADIALEFHTNAAGPGATGVETLSRRRHFPLGAQLCEAIADTLNIPDRGTKPEDAGQHHRLAFVSDGGGIIVELFFLTHPHDLRAYQVRKHDLARAVAGIVARAARIPYA